LNNLAAIIHGKLSKLQRMILYSLITVEFHARDTVTNLVIGKVTKRYLSYSMLWDWRFFSTIWL